MKGIKFIERNKAVIDLATHSDIMDYAIDRIIIKEPKKSGEFIPWDEGQAIIEKKCADELPNSNRKKALKFLQSVPKRDYLKLRNTFQI